MRDNFKNIHKRGGKIRLIIENEVYYEFRYDNTFHRKEIIKQWEYIIKNHSDVAIEISPNWDEWNGKY